MKATFKWIGGATWILTAGNISIACDPVLCDTGTVQDYKYFTSTRLNDPIYGDDDFGDVDLWLLTHGHDDHLDRAGLDKISPESSVVAHGSAGNKLERAGIKNYVTLKWDETFDTRIKGATISIKAVPAVHGRFEFLGKYIGNNNGYYVKMRIGNDSFSFYVTGDDVFNKGRMAGRLGPVDLAVANAGAAHVGTGFMGKIIGRITNNARDVEKLCRALNPKICIPVHWGTFTHYTDTTRNFRKDLPIKTLGVGQKAELSF